ncbi:N-acetyltransferase [Marinomonas sp. CT5]|uniref:GNAT family N-acetyltransferase n=1 Tax=Marinomonas sp. CT5 TaxID=2066133 RepID=UPI001BAE83DE|nr:GNAT family N-acetyltransferase [Marinomonas sp. CT5]QUX97221.1 N-acetyltransferase [Marinomonas sp. CT5]
MTISFQLRPANRNDAERLLVWRNDPQTRQASHHGEVISLEAHMAWLEKSLKSPDQRRLWVAEMNGKAVGTCRADRVENAWELSWTVAPESRGQGVAHQMLSQLMPLFNEPLSAQVKIGNIASVKVAERVGFVLDKQEQGVLFYVYPNKPFMAG